MVLMIVFIVVVRWLVVMTLIRMVVVMVGDGR